MQPPDGPPICTALNFLSFLMPPPISKITFLMGSPMGTSTRPPLLILPARANTLVPLLFSVPRAAKASPPLAMMKGRWQSLYVVDICGFTPGAFLCGKGGLSMGIASSPQGDAMRAVSSPQTKAPAPALMRNQRRNRFQIFLPSSLFLGCSMAISRREMARGYSALT